MLPKGLVGISFGQLADADCALVMIENNSEPTGKLEWITPWPPSTLSRWGPWASTISTSPPRASSTPSAESDGGPLG